MTSAQRKPISARVDEQVEMLRAQLDVMRGALAAHGVPTIEVAEWGRRLTPQQRALVGILMSAAPCAVDTWDILERLPSLDHAKDRSPELVRKIVSRVRSVLGSGAIESVAPGAYRLGRLSPTM